MSPQASVTVIAPIIPGKLASLERAVGVVNKTANPADPTLVYWDHDHGTQGRFRDYFRRMNEWKPHIHSARWFVLYAKEDKSDDSETSPGDLVYLASVDGTESDHIGHLSCWLRENRETVLFDQLYQYCRDFPFHGNSDQVRTYLTDHSATPQAYYVNRPGRTVSLVWRDAALREALAQFLDDGIWIGQTAQDVRQSVQAYARDRLGERPEPAPAALPQLLGLPGRLLRSALKRAGIRVIETISRISRQPWLRPEFQGSDEMGQLTPRELEQLEYLDDHGAAQSPFFVNGRIKPGVWRRWFTIILYRITNAASGFLYDEGSLAGLKTIHSARWLVLPDSRRAFFASTYDGSMENYNSDFVDIIPVGLNLTFGTAEGYPRTKLLIGGGASQEFEFRRVLHNHQATASIWYTAYPTFTALNLTNNAAIRAGLFEPMDESEAAAWLRRL